LSPAVNKPTQDQLAAKKFEDLDALDVTDREYWEDGPP
jgi:hypothetical protein